MLKLINNSRGIFYLLVGVFLAGLISFGIFHKCNGEKSIMDDVGEVLDDVIDETKDVLKKGRELSSELGDIREVIEDGVLDMLKKTTCPDPGRFQPVPPTYPPIPWEESYWLGTIPTEGFYTPTPPTYVNPKYGSNGIKLICSKKNKNLDEKEIRDAIRMFQDYFLDQTKPTNKKKDREEFKKNLREFFRKYHNDLQSQQQQEEDDDESSSVIVEDILVDKPLLEEVVWDCDSAIAEIGEDAPIMVNPFWRNYGGVLGQT